MSGGFSKLGVPTAVMLVGLAVVSAAAACDLPAPTSVASAVGETLGVRTESPAETQSRSTDPEAFGPLDQLPWTEDGRILIRGRSPTPSLGLNAARVAANPLVILDDNVVPGGLRALLSMMDTLDFRWVSSTADRDAIERFGDRARESAVVIRTGTSAGRSVAAFQNATGPDGRVRIQGTDSLPAITLRADVAARNPRAQVDGEFVEGGLRKLLTMMDTLNFVSGGYYGFPPRVVVNTGKRGVGR